MKLKPKANAVVLHAPFDGRGPPPLTFQAMDIRCTVCGASEGSDCRFGTDETEVKLGKNGLGIHWGRFEKWSSDRQRFDERGHLGLTFGEALIALKAGQKVERRGWNGKGMWLLLVMQWSPQEPDWRSIQALPVLPFIAMKTADEKIVPWLASQTDMLAEDWKIVP